MYISSFKSNHQNVILGEVITTTIIILNHRNFETKPVNTNSET